MTQKIIKKVWIHVLQDVLIDTKEHSTRSVETLLNNKLAKCDPENKTSFNVKSITKLLAFFKGLGKYKSLQMAQALEFMFLTLPITRVKIPRKKKVFVTVWSRETSYTYEEYDSIKNALKVYGRVKDGFKGAFREYEGVSPGIVARQLKKERLGEKYWSTPSRGGVSVKFSVNGYSE